MIAQITINGQKHPLYFGLMALEIFTKKVGHLQSDSVLQIEQTTALIWAGLKQGYYRKGEELPLSFADVADGVEESYMTAEGQEELKAAMAAFADSRAVKPAKEELKKKAAKAKVKP